MPPSVLCCAAVRLISVYREFIQSLFLSVRFQRGYGFLYCKEVLMDFIFFFCWNKVVEYQDMDFHVYDFISILFWRLLEKQLAKLYVL